MVRKVSVKVKAYQSDGLSRHCGKCDYNPCSLDMRRLCTNRFVEISKDMQEQRKILKKVNELRTINSSNTVDSSFFLCCTWIKPTY